jgi:hypothetical protein
MDKKQFDRLMTVLTRIDENTNKLFTAATQPEKFGQKIMNAVGLGAGIAGIMSLVDILKNWFGG